MCFSKFYISQPCCTSSANSHKLELYRGSFRSYLLLSLEISGILQGHMFITGFIRAYAKPDDANPHLHSIYPAKSLLLPVGFPNKILCVFLTPIYRFFLSLQWICTSQRPVCHLVMLVLFAAGLHWYFFTLNTRMGFWTNWLNWRKLKLLFH